MPQTRWQWKPVGTPLHHSVGLYTENRKNPSEIRIVLIHATKKMYQVPFFWDYKKGVPFFFWGYEKGVPFFSEALFSLEEPFYASLREKKNGVNWKDTHVTIEVALFVGNGFLNDKKPTSLEIGHFCFFCVILLVYLGHGISHLQAALLFSISFFGLWRTCLKLRNRGTSGKKSRAPSIGGRVKSNTVNKPTEL